MSQFAACCPHCIRSNSQCPSCRIRLTTINFFEDSRELVIRGSGRGEVEKTATNAVNSNWKALSIACKLGRLDMVQFLLQQADIDITCVDQHGMTLLHEAVQSGHLGIVQILVNKNANIFAQNNDGLSAYDIAVTEGKTHIANYLAKEAKTMPVQKQNEEAKIKAAMKKGNMLELHQIIENTKFDINCMFQDGNTPLCHAIECNNFDLAEFFINIGSDVEKPNQNGETPLIYACKLGRTELCQMLLKFNAKCNTTNPIENKWTALHYAADANDEKLVLALLKAGAIPTAKIFSHSPQDCTQSHTIKYILSQHEKKYEFDAMVREITANGDATVDQLDKLTDKFTSVYDLRPLCSIANTLSQCSPSITMNSFKPVLLKALDRIIEDKMVVDDYDLLFFKNAMKFCHKNGFLSETEYKLRKHRACKANIQNIEFLNTIMRQVQENNWHLNVMHQQLDKVIKAYQQVETNTKHLYNGLNNLQRAVVQQSEHAKKIEKKRRRLGFVSMILSFVGGPFIKEIGNHVIDLANPAEVFNFAIEREDMDSFLHTNWEKVNLKPMITSALEKAFIREKDFIETLQSAIRVDSEFEFGGTDNLRKSDCTLMLPRGSLRTRTGVGLPIRRSLPELKFIQQSDSSKAFHSYKWVDTIENFPFHWAIQVSCGNADEYSKMAAHIKDTDDDINASIRVQVNGTETKWTPLEFATYLGYDDIVEKLVVLPNVVKKEKQCNYIIQAKAKKNAAITLA